MHARALEKKRLVKGIRESAKGPRGEEARRNAVERVSRVLEFTHESRRYQAGSKLDWTGNKAVTLTRLTFNRLTFDAAPSRSRKEKRKERSRKLGARQSRWLALQKCRSRSGYQTRRAIESSESARVSTGR
jgi:hypothetical protein